MLVVRDAFADYQRGDTIRDAAEVQAVYDAGQGGFCTEAMEAVEAPPQAPAAKASTT